MSINLPKYPLEEVLEIKEHRVEVAEKVVKEKLRELEKEKEKLKQCEEARDKVKKHLKAKYDQMFAEFDKGISSAKIEQMKAYIDVVKDRIVAEEQKVKQQQEQVEVAEKNVEMAKEQLKMRRNEQDKIETHKEEWLKEAKAEVALLETREEDEIGTTMFLSKITLKKSTQKKRR